MSLRACPVHSPFYDIVATADDMFMEDVPAVPFAKVLVSKLSRFSNRSSLGRLIHGLFAAIEHISKLKGGTRGLTSLFSSGLMSCPGSIFLE